MKKLLSFLTVCTMVLTSMPAMKTNAEDADIKAIASAFGADTDYLNIPCTKEVQADPSGKIEVIDESFGIAAFEVLLHNKYISLADVQKDAAYMNEIADTPELRTLIDDYKKQYAGGNFYLLNGYKFKNCSAEDKIPALISMAETASQKGEYFLIRLGIDDHKGVKDDDTQSVDYIYSMVGIGAVNGSWTFNNKHFDKCILTLDPYKNGVFSENSCIYVNSETNDYYIEKYSDSADSDVHIVAFSMDELTNGDRSEIIRIDFINNIKSTIYDIDIEKDGEKKLLNRDNNYLDFYHDLYNGVFYVKADSVVTINRMSREVDGILITTDNQQSEISLEKADSTLEYERNRNRYHLTRKYNAENTEVSADSPLKYSLTWTPDYKENSPKYSIDGETMSDVYFEYRDKNIILDSLDSEKNVEVSIVVNEDYNNVCRLTSAQKVMLTYDADMNFSLLIDNDSDGKFESEVQKGDVNCDGMIDASDASMILAAYADVSVGKENLLNQKLADYNNDGKIDAVDASDVLNEYSELATS